MRVLIVFVAVATTAIVMSLDCPNHDPMQDCQHIFCDRGYMPACDKDVCTCVSEVSHNCSTRSDCDDVMCRPEDLHCFDAKCQCHGGHQPPHGQGPQLGK